MMVIIRFHFKLIMIVIISCADVIWWEEFVNFIRSDASVLYFNLVLGNVLCYVVHAVTAMFAVLNFMQSQRMDMT